jgi:DNA polymerase V
MRKPVPEPVPDALGDAEIDRLAAAPVGSVRRIHRIPSGFPSPAEDSAEPALDIRTLLVKRPEATFFLRMRGEAMCESGIYPGDVLVVDRSLEPVYGDVVVAAAGGELLARHYCPETHGVVLLPSSDAWAPIWVPESRPGSSADYRVWGVVTFAIHPVHRVHPPSRSP